MTTTSSWWSRDHSGHVIIVRSALYGRMRARRCITSDYANALGCYSDVTGHVDAVCAGRQNCSLLVATMDSVAQPCAKDFKSYLEAAYDCVPGDRRLLGRLVECHVVPCVTLQYRCIVPKRLDGSSCSSAAFSENGCTEWRWRCSASYSCCGSRSCDFDGLSLNSGFT